jgi:hypothetical protein
MVTRKQEYVDISGSPEVVKLVEDVSAGGTPRVLRRNGKDVATLSPLPKRPHAKGKPAARRKTGILTKDDPLFKLIGIGDSAVPGGYSARKHELEAKALLHD